MSRALPPPTASTALAAALLTALLFAARPALARPDAVSTAELNRLPEYCIDTEGFGYGHKRSANRSPRAGHWEGLMGDGFWTLHHYCYGLIHRLRLGNGSVIPARRSFTVGQMISEYYFVINNTQPGFVLLPEVWTRIGEGELMRNNIGAAHDAFATARKLKPDYWPAYSMWAEVLIKAKSQDRARAILAEGLAHAPDATTLQDQFRKLGGDPAKVARAAPPPTAGRVAEPARAASAPVAEPAGATSAPASAAGT